MAKPRGEQAKKAALFPAWDFRGRKVGRLTVDRIASGLGGVANWECRCACSHRMLFPAKRIRHWLGSKATAERHAMCGRCKHRAKAKPQRPPPAPRRRGRRRRRTRTGPTKRCSMCQRTFARTTEFFAAAYYTRSGLLGRCRGCVGEGGARGKHCGACEDMAHRRPEDGSPCPGCGQLYVAETFRVSAEMLTSRPGLGAVEPACDGW